MSAFQVLAEDGVAWMDGALIPSSQARLHFLSHGLDNASCVFEGERVYGGKIFRLQAHSQRLFDSAAIVGMAVPWSAAAIAAATEATVAAQNISEGYVRPVVWRGHEALGIGSDGTTVHLAIAALPLKDVVPEAVRRVGVRLATSRWRRPAPETAPVKAKAAAAYLLSGLALREAAARGFDDALLLDQTGAVAEATGANVFFVRGGRLITPPPMCFIDGITRQTVIALARERRIPVEERRVEPGEIGACEEAFLTGTAAEVLAIRQIDAYTFPAARPVCDKVIAAYGALVRGR